VSEDAVFANFILHPAMQQWSARKYRHQSVAPPAFDAARGAPWPACAKSAALPWPAAILPA
jgi:hypothetical protein